MEAMRDANERRMVRAMADVLLIGFIAGYIRGGWSTGFLRRLVGLGYMALAFVIGAYLRQPIGAIIDCVTRTLEKAEPELSADLVDRGLVMAGGGALLRGIDRLVAEETGLINIDCPNINWLSIDFTFASVR